MMASVAEFAETAPDFQRAAWREVCVPACRGLLAHARGDYSATVRNLSPVIPRLEEIGGSHAQRDLFVLVARDAGER